eukprot:813381_1
MSTIYDIDLSIFVSKESRECNQMCDDPIFGCMQLKKLIVTLMYYQHLDVQHNANSQAIFIAFINDVYNDILEDYAHLVKKHNNLEDINKALKSIKVFAACDVTKCLFTSRHQSPTESRHSMNTTTIMDPVVQFYVKLIDSLHFYLVHLFECGLRTVRPNPDTVDTDECKQAYVDTELTRISRMVHERRDIRLAFNRLQSISKFNIQTAVGSSDTLYMDEAIRYLLLSPKNINIHENAIRKVYQFLTSQQYDSESLKGDIKHGLASHIASNIDKDVFESLAEFVKATELRSSSFNIGLTFYYWPEYANVKVMNTDQYNVNDHGGYAVSELCVPKKYATFKDEILNYTSIGVVQYDGTLIKVKKYMETESIKSIKAFNEGSDGSFVMLRYNIRHGDPILPRHLAALFLYTDFTDLCTNFSSTFRAIKQFEPLWSIKTRNSNYWWMSKSLRELVELFGERMELDSEWNYTGLTDGPFYCGLTTVMPFPEFEVRLCGPTSTTYQIEIAVNFAGSEGIIVQLNNTVAYHYNLSGFRCGWLSDFKEEDEVLFMGGHYRIKIESVRILKGKGGQCQNYETFFGALTQLNKMFNGYLAHNVSSDEKVIIRSLLEWMSKKQNNVKIDQYILDTFQYFCLNKTKIVVNPFALSAYGDSEVLDRVFYALNSGDDFLPIKEDKTNLFRKDVFEIFQNLKTIDIYTTEYDGYGQAALSFTALLNEILSFTSLKVISVKSTRYKTEKSSWIQMLWSQQMDHLQEMYESKGLKIMFRNEKSDLGCVVDCIVIKRM